MTAIIHFPQGGKNILVIDTGLARLVKLIREDVLFGPRVSFYVGCVEEKEPLRCVRRWQVRKKYKVTYQHELRVTLGIYMPMCFKIQKFFQLRSIYESSIMREAYSIGTCEGGIISIRVQKTIYKARKGIKGL